MKAVFKLLNSYYIKGFFGPFFVIVFPILLLFIMGNAMETTAASIPFKGGAPDPKKYMQGVIAGIMITSLISNGLIGFPIMIIEFKKSTLMKRIGAANISKKSFFVSVLAYQFLWSVFSIIWTLTWGGIIIGTKNNYDFSVSFSDNLPIALPFMLLTLFISLSMGLVIVSLTNTTQGVTGLANVLYLPISFLSGSFIPKDQINSSRVLDTISYILPTKYAVDPFFVAFREGLNGLQNGGWEMWVFPLIAMGFIGLSILIGIKKFKWSN